MRTEFACYCVWQEFSHHYFGGTVPMPFLKIRDVSSLYRINVLRILFNEKMSDLSIANKLELEIRREIIFSFLDKLADMQILYNYTQTQ